MSPTARRMGAFALVALVVVAADQLTKAWALNALGDNHRIDVLGSWLSLVLVRNSGAAFSLGAGFTGILTVVAIGVTLTIIVLARRLASTGWAIVLGLLLGGALGNLIDRLCREPGIGRGHVVDFIAYGSWFVGNVADIAIVVGAALIVILVMRGVPLTAGPAASGQDPASKDAAGESSSGEGPSGEDAAGS